MRLSFLSPLGQEITDFWSRFLAESPATIGSAAAGMPLQGQFRAVAPEKLNWFLSGLQGRAAFSEQASKEIVLALETIAATSGVGEHDHEGHDHAEGETCALPREPQQLVDDDRRFYGDLKRAAAGEAGAAAILKQRYGLSQESVDALLRRLGVAGAGTDPAGADSLATESLSLASTFQLHSNPGSNFTIYLDFDGHITSGTGWNTSYNGGASIVSPAYDPERNGSGFSDTELLRIQQIWARVAEDFAPFDVNVTTEDPGAAALSRSGTGDAAWGIRVVITGDQSWIQDDLGYAIGGIAYINSFNSSTDTPTFVFNSSEIGVSAAVSHEVGHTLGLAHDGTTAANPLQASAAYYNGHGSGETDWGPIMGTGYYANVTQWDQGEYIGANNTGASANYNRGADDLAVITTYNGFGYRPDDHANSQFGASALSVLGVNAANASLLDVSQFGMIQSRTDTDWFSFQTGTGVVNLTIDSYVNQGWISNGGGSYSWFLEPTFYSTSWPNNQGSNLDIQARLYDTNGALVATSNPLGLSAAFTNLTLSAGTYFIEIDGINYGDPLNSAAPTGYSDYGSIGQYAIKGTVQAGGPVSFVLDPPAGLTTTEGGEGASFTVALSEAPTEEVVLRLSSSDPATGGPTVTELVLVFTSENWYLPQAVTLASVDDWLALGDRTYQVLFAPAESADSRFSGVRLEAITVQHSDNDTPVQGTSTAQSVNLVNNVSYSLAPQLTGDPISGVTLTEGQVTTTTTSGKGKNRNSTTAVTSVLDAGVFRFDGLENATALQFNGFRSDRGEGDNFLLQLSTDDGASWSTLHTVSNTTASSVTVDLTSSPITGSALVRFVDTDRTAGYDEVDTLTINSLGFVSTLTDLRSTLTLQATSEALEEGGDPVTLTLQRTGGDLNRTITVDLERTGFWTDAVLLDKNGNPVSNSVSFAAGETQLTLSLSMPDNGVELANQSLSLNLAADDNQPFQLGSSSAVTVQLFDAGTLPDPITRWTATSQSTLYGSVSGSLDATYKNDALTQIISEVESGGKPNIRTSQLEHTWFFDQITGAQTLELVAAKGGSGPDSFSFAYSLDGISWSPLGIVSTEDVTTFRWDLDQTLSGSIWVRVTDTDRSSAERILDSIAVDSLAFLA